MASLVRGRCAPWMHQAGWACRCVVVAWLVAWCCCCHLCGGMGWEPTYGGGVCSQPAKQPTQALWRWTRLVPCHTVAPPQATGVGTQVRWLARQGYTHSRGGWVVGPVDWEGTHTHRQGTGTVGWGGGAGRGPHPGDPSRDGQRAPTTGGRPRKFSPPPRWRSLGLEVGLGLGMPLGLIRVMGWGWGWGLLGWGSWALGWAHPLRAWGVGQWAGAC